MILTVFVSFVFEMVVAFLILFKSPRVYIYFIIQNMIKAYVTVLTIMIANCPCNLNPFINGI